MDNLNIKGVKLTQLKRIFHPQGDIFHVLKRTDLGYVDFGEAYFSTIKYREIKSWKKHLCMTLNLIVPVGKIKFVLYDARVESETNQNYFEVVLSIDKFYRLTIPPKIWVAFQGLEPGLNLLLNITDIEHDPLEIERLNLKDIAYEW